MDVEELIAEDAAEWLLRLDNASPQEIDDFRRWLLGSPLHVREFLVAIACHVVLTQLFRHQRLHASELARSSSNVRAITHIRAGDRLLGPREIDRGKNRFANSLASIRPWLRLTVAAILIAIVVAAIVTIHAISRANGVATGPGEWQTTHLSDGTTMHMGPRTKALIEYTEPRRTIRLLHGRAVFHVSKQSTRPFFVDAGRLTVRAVGTIFAVSHETPDLVRVTVKEGTVHVTPTLCARPAGTIGAMNAPTVLNAGEEVDMGSTGPLGARQVDVDMALAWVDGRLIFEQETLEQAVHQFNRLNAQQIQIADPRFASHTVRGSFSAGDPKAFASYLERQGEISVIEQSGTLRLVSSAKQQ